MGRTPSDRVTREVARELCLRTGSKAMLSGSISNLGSQYVVGLDAVDCSSGDTLAKEQEEAASKEDVLKALGKAAASLRAKLGESLASVQKFDVPVEATTPSLEALKAFSMGITTSAHKGRRRGHSVLETRLELDPNFAMAYAGLGVAYGNLGQASLAAENIKKAYDLRDRVSEREKYRISALYYQYVTGELEKASASLRTVGQELSAGHGAARQLGSAFTATLGQYEKAVAETQEAHASGTDADWLRQPRRHATLHSTGWTTPRKRSSRRKRTSWMVIFCTWTIYDLAFLQGRCSGDGAAGGLGRGQARERRPPALVPVRYRGLLRTAGESTRLLPACGGFGSPRRLQGDGGAVAGECCAAGGGVRQRSSRKARCRGSIGAGSGPGRKSAGRSDAGASRRNRSREGAWSTNWKRATRRIRC